jgi:hypothetical protein
VTRWGVLLLVAYVGLGLSGLDARQALRYVIAVTIVIVGLAGIEMGGL